MPDTLDQLCSREPMFPRSEAVERAAVGIESAQYSWFPYSQEFAIRIDGHRVGFLHVFRSRTTFSVRPGEHQVTVQCGRFASEPLTIRVEPGERVEVICGQKEPFARLQMRFMRGIFAVKTLGWGLGAIAWFS